MSAARTPHPTNNSQPVQKPTDELREAIVKAAAFNTKHISTYDPSMKNLIINVGMLVEQMTALFATQTAQLKEQVLEAIGEDEELPAPHLQDSIINSSAVAGNMLRAKQRAAINKLWSEL